MLPDFFLLGLLPYISYCCMIFEDLGGRRTSKMGAGEKKEPLQKMILKNACEEKMGHRRRRSETTGKKTAPPTRCEQELVKIPLSLQNMVSAGHQLA